MRNSGIAVESIGSFGGLGDIIPREFVSASSEDVGSGRRVLLSTTVSKNTAHHRITITGGKVLLLLFILKYHSYRTIRTS